LSLLLSFYQTITRVLGPSIYRALQRRRILKGKEIANRRQERCGKGSLKRPTGPLIWFHAASNGESLSTLAVMEALYKAHPHLRFLVTSATLTSAELLAKRLPDYACHQFIPYDVPQWIDHFLDHWQPDLFILIESEIWPNMIVQTSKRHIPLLFISAQISESSVRAWRWGKSFMRALLSRFTLVLAQSNEQAERLKKMGAEKIIVAGNIKFAGKALMHEPGELAALKDQIGERPIWLAASTHPGEEEFILQAHRLLQQSFPTLLTIIVPRHPDRAAELMALCQKQDFQVARRSQGTSISFTTEIYLADTSGEMGLFYNLSTVVFLGGSLVAIGGHNLIEPALLNCALLHGPFMHEQKEMTRLFSEVNATIQVESAADLAENVGKLLNDTALRDEYAQRAKQVAQSQTQVLGTTLLHLEPFIKGLQA
jgi:3-deoxy-D-manno-octulosonic-acid transferase